MPIGWFDWSDFHSVFGPKRDYKHETVCDETQNLNETESETKFFRY